MRKKTILKALTALLFNSVMGITVALVLGINPVLGVVLANVAAAILGQFAPQGALQAGVLTEVWTGDLRAAGLTAFPTRAPLCRTT